MKGMRSSKYPSFRNLSSAKHERRSEDQIQNGSNLGGFVASKKLNHEKCEPHKCKRANFAGVAH